MTFIRGVWGSVDDVGSPYHNDIEDYRALLWDIYHQTQGIIHGFDLSYDSGSLSVTFSPGSAIVQSRGTDINGDQMGYHVWNNVDTQVTFDPPDAATRNDALVFAWGDPQYGALGASVDGPGPQIVVVKGVSGSPAARTDSQINTAIGPGGWFRFADVQIEPGDVQVNPANLVVDPEAYAGGYVLATMSSQETRVPGGESELNFTNVVELRGGVVMTNSDTRFFLNSGLWNIESLVSVEGGDAGANWAVKLLRNGVTEEALPFTMNSGSTRDTTATLVKTLRIAEGDYLEVFVLNNGATSNLTVLPGASKTFICMRRVDS